jgi:uncharacterized membrane protein
MESKPNKETLEKWSKDPNNWVLGMFYYNKEDQRLMPPKRIAWMGWTINFANYKSVLLMIGMILFFVLIVSIIQKKH